MEKLNITRYAMSKILNASPANVYKFLDGGRRSVGAEKMVSIAKVIGLSSALALFEIEPVKDLIHHLDITQKNRAFQKANFYLRYKCEYDTNNQNIHDQLESLSIAMLDVIPDFDILTPSTIVQYLSDYLIHDSIGETIIRKLLENKYNNLLDVEINYDLYIPLEGEIIYKSFIPFDSKRDKKEPTKEELMRMMNESRSTIIEEYYRRRLDIYYKYIKEEIPLKVAEEKLNLIDELEASYIKPKINDLDYIFYQIFNNEMVNYPIRIEEFNDQYNRTKRINLYDKIQSNDIEISLKYCFNQHQIPYKETKNTIIGVKINDNSINKVIPTDNYAVIELDANYENGDYVLVSIQKEDAVIAIIQKLQSFIGAGKIFIKYVSSNEAHENRTYNQDEIEVLGKVIDIITIIKK